MKLLDPPQHVFLFSPRFVDLVVEGRKRQTIRGPRKRPVRPGDLLSLRAWECSPYRSPQVLLREAICSSVAPIEIASGMPPGTILPAVLVTVGGTFLDLDATERFARADGFAGYDDFARWRFGECRGRPKPATFQGILIRWEV